MANIDTKIDLWFKQQVIIIIENYIFLQLNNKIYATGICWRDNDHKHRLNNI